MRRVLGLVVAVVVATGCSPPPETTAPAETAGAEPRGGATGVADGATPGATEPDVRDAATVGATAGPEDRAREAVVAGREAAWDARVESMGPPEADPGSSALHETHTGIELVVVISVTELHWMNERVLRHLPRSSLEVRSVTLPEDGVAWIETCVAHDREHVSNRTGNVLQTGTGTATQQRTEVMREEDGTWRLADSLLISSEGGVADCATDKGPQRPVDDDTLSEEAIVDARETAEQAWIDAITGVGEAEPSDSYTGYLVDLLDNDRKNTRFVRMHCPWLPMDRGLWPENQRRSYDGEAGRTPEDCLRQVYRSHPEAYVGDQNLTFGDGSTSRVVVESVVMQETDRPEVTYLRTCREHDLKRTGETLHLVDKATIRSTEAMRLEDGAWKLAARWDFTVDEGVADGCR